MARRGVLTNKLSQNRQGRLVRSVPDLTRVQATEELLTGDAEQPPGSAIEQCSSLLGREDLNPGLPAVEWSVPLGPLGHHGRLRVQRNSPL